MADFALASNDVETGTADVVDGGTVVVIPGNVTPLAGNCVTLEAPMVLTGSEVDGRDMGLTDDAWSGTVVVHDGETVVIPGKVTPLPGNCVKAEAPMVFIGSEVDGTDTGMTDDEGSGTVNVDDGETVVVIPGNITPLAGN